MRRARLKSVCAEALGIRRKNIYHEWKQPAKDQALKQQIKAVHREHQAYSHRQVTIHQGINNKRAQRVMAKFNLHPPRRLLKRYSTLSTLHHSYRNLLTDRTVSQPHQVWCSGLSRIAYRSTVWYLGSVDIWWIIGGMASTITFREDQWQKIYQFLEEHPNVYVGGEDKMRTFMEAILWMSRSGTQWRLLPAEFWLFSDQPYGSAGALRSAAFSAFSFGGLGFDLSVTALSVSIWRDYLSSRWIDIMFLLAVPMDDLSFFTFSPFFSACILGVVVGVLLLRNIEADNGSYSP